MHNFKDGVGDGGVLCIYYFFPFSFPFLYVGLVLDLDKEKVITEEVPKENGDSGGDAPGKMTRFEMDLRDSR